MQLITLNIWGGHVYVPLIQFIKQYQEVDVFCFQEVYHNAHRTVSNEDRVHHLNIFSELQSILHTHRAFFRPVVDSIYGIAIFVKDNINILSEGEVNIYHNFSYPGSGPTHSRNLQWLECDFNNQKYAILNVHGLWNGMGKTDSPDRIIQSQRIKEFMDTIDIPKILCGDFNLRPDTDSLSMLEQGMVNLIKRNNVTSTRTSLYSKEEKFADYIFTSPEVIINKFTVLEDEVSDHSPLFLDFIIQEH